MKIQLSGKNSKNKTTSIIIPVNPEKINYKTEGRFQEYEIINKGPAKVPNGQEISFVSWESFFPGASLKKMPFVQKYTAPKTIHNTLEYWRKNGIKVKVLITTTPINMYTYIESYETSFEGADGSIYYSIEFSGAVDVKIETVKKKKVATKNKTTGNNRTSTKSETRTYTIKSGDTLWAIATKYYGNGSQYTKIYNANKDMIEKEAKKHGKSSSSSGHWIYPGNTLIIP